MTTEQARYSQKTACTQLPIGWEFRRLSSLTKSYSGGTPDRSKPEYFDGNIPWVKSGEVNKRRIFKTEEFITADALKNSSAKLVEMGAILVAMYGATAGKIAQLRIDAAINQAILSIRSNGIELDNEFLFWVLESNAEKLLTMCQGAAQPNLSKGLIDGLNIATPPLCEQRKIATILTAVDNKLDVIVRQISSTQTLKHGLKQTLFSHGFGTQNTKGRWVSHKSISKKSNTTNLPPLWKLTPFGEIAPIIRRPVEIEADVLYPELGMRSFGKGTFHKPAISGIDVGNKRLFKIHVGDLMFSNVFAWEGSVAIAKQEDDGRFGSHRYITCKVDNTRANTLFLYRYITTPAGIEQLKLASPGGAGRNRTLGLSALAAIKIPLPPLDEQNRITEILNSVDAKLDLLITKQTHYQTLKRGLMQKLLTGEWRVKFDAVTEEQA